MIRWGLFFVIIGAAAYVAGWLAGHPGMVSLQWLGYRLDTSVAVLIAVVGLLILVAAVLYRLWWTVLRAPKLLVRSRHDRRQRRGFKALGRGLVALAAGDVETARRQAERASELIDDRPLTLLLLAQTAQLQGDDQAAERYFRSMLNNPSTEFLGVRGLLTQAMKREDWGEALNLARRAYRLNPKSEWVVSTLYELQKRTGQWSDAVETLNQEVKMKLIPPPQAEEERAELDYRRSLAASGAEALRWARSAYRHKPGFVAAAVRWGKLLIADGRHRKAAGVIEQAWSDNPHPDLAALYWRARQCTDAPSKLETAKRLAAANPGHLQSRLIVAEAAIEARQWEVARKQLEPVAGEYAPPEVCRLMAELEEGEHGDLLRARAWLLRASEGKPHAEEQEEAAGEETPAGKAAAAS